MPSITRFIYKLMGLIILSVVNILLDGVIILDQYIFVPKLDIVIKIPFMSTLDVIPYALHDLSYNYVKRLKKQEFMREVRMS